MATELNERYDNGTRPVIFAQLLSAPAIPDGDRSQVEPTDMTVRTKCVATGEELSYTAADNEITLGGLYPTFTFPARLTTPGDYIVEVWCTDGTYEDTTVVRFAIDVSPFT